MPKYILIRFDFNSILCVSKLFQFNSNSKHQKMWNWPRTFSIQFQFQCMYIVSLIADPIFLKMLENQCVNKLTSFSRLWIGPTIIPSFCIAHFTEVTWVESSKTTSSVRSSRPSWRRLLIPIFPALYLSYKAILPMTWKRTLKPSHNTYRVGKTLTDKDMTLVLMWCHVLLNFLFVRIRRRKIQGL